MGRKLRFLLIHENILKSTAMVRSEYIDYIVPDLSQFFWR